MTTEKIRVAIFEDNSDLREGLYHILNASPGFLCVGSYANCIDIIDHIYEVQPTVLLMDIQMPGITGIEAVSIIRNKFPDLPILIQTVFEDETKVFAAICAGANGYILKNIPPVKMLEAIKEVEEGGSPMTPTIATKVLRMLKEQNSKPGSTRFDLTERETEILSQLTNGLSYKMIAAKLYISYETVHSHVKSIYHKLQVNSASEAIIKALRNKIV